MAVKTGATAYPGGLDTFDSTIETTSTQADAAQDHSQTHANIAAAVNAMQAELGANPSLTAATVAAFLAAIPIANLAGYPADGTQVLLGDGTWGANATSTVLALLSGTDLTAPGWVTSPNTWVYSTPTQLMEAGVDTRARYPLGTKLRCIDNGQIKYFYVKSNPTYTSSNTFVNVTAGSDNVLEGGAISSPYYSYMSSPSGFPHWFNWTPSFTNVAVGTGAGGTVEGKFAIAGRTLDVHAGFVLGSSAFSVGAIQVVTPVTMASHPRLYPLGGAYFYDSNPGAIYGGDCRYYDTTHIAALSRSGATTTEIQDVATSSVLPFTWAANDSFSMQARVEI